MKKPLKTSAEGRRCQFKDCNRLLSIYNHQAYCRIHWGEVARDEKPKPYRHI